MDERKNNGGARPGAGRKPKAEELALADRIDKYMAPDEVWERLSEFAKKDVKALQILIQYRYGMPKQIIDMKTNIEPIEFKVVS